MEYRKIDIENIAIEERGKFRIDGEMSIEQRRLRGTIRLGLTREYLDWLPNPEEVFSRKQDGIYGPMCICLERSMTPGKI